MDDLIKELLEIDKNLIDGDVATARLKLGIIVKNLSESITLTKAIGVGILRRDFEGDPFEQQ